MQKIRVETKCDTCGRIIYLTQYEYGRSKHHFCCRECYYKFDKGILVEKTKEPYRIKSFKGDRRLYHRWVVEQAIGRKLGRNEYVHHINGDKQDNRLENLQVLTPLEHNRLHNEKLPKTKICKVCGKEFEPSVNHRGRSSICSRECLRKWQKQTSVFKDRPIQQYDKNGNYIKTFSSVKQASIEIGGESTNIVKCARGKIKSAYGYKWQYSGK